MNFVDLPIKCPVAPVEFLFLADAYFRKRKWRQRVKLSLVTPLDGAFTKATCATYLSHMFDDRGIEVVTQFNSCEVDGDAGRLVSYDGREVRFDLGVVIPLHQGAAFVGRSAGLGDALDFVRTDPHTLQSKVAPNIRDRRCCRPPDLESRFGGALRWAHRRGEHPAVLRERAAEARNSTGTRTVSLKVEVERRSSSISTTRLSPFPAAFRGASGFLCSESRDLTTWANSDLRASTGTPFFPDARSPESDHACREQAKRSARMEIESPRIDDKRR